MRTAYQINDQMIATGVVFQLGDFDARPIDTVVSEIPPPDGIAQWQGRWVKLDELPTITPLQPEIPQSITRAQAKLALLQVGLLDDVQPAIDAISDPIQRKAAQIEWNDRLTFDRTNPTLQALAAMLGMTDAQLDELFVLGNAL